VATQQHVRAKLTDSTITSPVTLCSPRGVTEMAKGNITTWGRIELIGRDELREIERVKTNGGYAKVSKVKGLVVPMFPEVEEEYLQVA